MWKTPGLFGGIANRHQFLHGVRCAARERAHAHSSDTQTTKAITRPKIAFMAAIGSLTCLVSAEAGECMVVGSPATFGANMNGSFEVDAGSSCHYAFNLRGAVESSKVVTPAKNDAVRMLNLTSFEYHAHSGYRGPDSFAIEAIGESQTGKGTSILSMSVAVK
jgi:hypothetical protein